VGRVRLGIRTRRDSEVDGILRRGSAGNRILLKKKRGLKIFRPPRGVAERQRDRATNIATDLQKRAIPQRSAQMRCHFFFSSSLALPPSLPLSPSLFPRTSEYDFPDFFSSSFFSFFFFSLSLSLSLSFFLQMLRPIVYPGNPHFPARE